MELVDFHMAARALRVGRGGAFPHGLGEAGSCRKRVVGRFALARADADLGRQVLGWHFAVPHQLCV